MKKVLFTGARSGIASGVIKKLLDKDYFIYVSVHTEEQLKAVKKTYENYHNVECIKLDVTDEKDKEKLKAIDIDILVSNAAIGEGGSISEIPMEKVRNNFEVNVFSNFEIVQIILKKLLQKQDGKIIMISSLFAHLPFNFLGVYCSTKASVSMLTRTLKNELKLINDKIKIVLIEPGSYHTGFNQVMLNNKYDWMSIDSYFRSEINNIRTKENIIMRIIERNRLNSIVNKITKAITTNNPHFLYRAPFSQALLVKMYNILKN